MGVVFLIFYFSSLKNFAVSGIAIKAVIRSLNGCESWIPVMPKKCDKINTKGIKASP